MAVSPLQNVSYTPRRGGAGVTEQQEKQCRLRHVRDTEDSTVVILFGTLCASAASTDDLKVAPW